MVYMGDNYHRCAKCLRVLVFGETIFHSKRCGARYRYICQKCSEREHMPNIKITAEVNGKQVPLENISTETFEAIKALEKPKEIPVARWATFSGEPRLIFIPSQDIQFQIGRVYALDLYRGGIGTDWSLEDDDGQIKQYQRITPVS